MLKVKKSTLLLVAGLVWLAAGVNILRIGVQAMLSCFRVWLLAGAVVILIGFFLMFFKIVKKHTKRIMGYLEEKKSIFYFFDLKGYLLMAFMMGLGIALRHGNFLPAEFFAVFYSGLGTALSVAGILFLKNWMEQR